MEEFDNQVRPLLGQTGLVHEVHEGDESRFAFNSSLVGCEVALACLWHGKYFIRGAEGSDCGSVATYQEQCDQGALYITQQDCRAFVHIVLKSVAKPPRYPTICTPYTMRQSNSSSGRHDTLSRYRFN
jgi:hypothetical protein